MRKGIVMEQKKRYMIIMTNDGQFHRAKRIEGAEMGMEVQFESISEPKMRVVWTKMVHNSPYKIAAVALAFLLAILPIWSWYGNNQTYAYVNIDINPSVELEINEKMQVLGIDPKNDEASEIVSMMTKWKKKDASEVAFELIRLSQEQGYVNSEKQVLIGISYKDTIQSDQVSQQMEAYLVDQSADWSVTTFLVPDQIRQKANEKNQSVNQFMADRIKEKNETEAESEPVPVTIKEKDKEIIQSFYKEEDPSTQVKGIQINRSLLEKQRVMTYKDKIQKSAEQKHSSKKKSNHTQEHKPSKQEIHSNEKNSSVIVEEVPTPAENKPATQQKLDKQIKKGITDHKNIENSN
ncbi:anti-sigma factor domain-containing protein [Halobacillus yeomjeoni]